MKRVHFVGASRHSVGMTTELSAELLELAAAQGGVLTRAQALSGGLTPTILRFRLERGRWQRLETGVYAVFSGPPGRRTVLWGAVLRSGPGAVLSYQTAAELAGLTDRPSSLIHITVPGDRYVERIPGIVIHRSSRVSQARHPVLAPPRTRLEETVLDLAGAAATLDDACGWITRALGRRLTTQAELHEAMALRAKLRWRRQLAQAMTAEWGGVHSSLEYRYLRDVERPHLLPHGVRQARAQQGRGAIYRDVLYEQFALAVELDGRVAHPGDQRWPDIQRDNAAAADGILTLRYGWFDVTERPCEIAAQVAQALRLRGYTLAQGCSTACPTTAVNHISRRRRQAG
jgi:predicted transcriptional regulator of viral defense system